MAPPEQFFDDPNFLRDRGILAPEITEFTHWLREQGKIPADTVLPLGLEAGLELVKSALTGNDS